MSFLHIAKVFIARKFFRLVSAHCNKFFLKIYTYSYIILIYSYSTKTIDTEPYNQKQIFFLITIIQFSIH